MNDKLHPALAEHRLEMENEKLRGLLREIRDVYNTHRNEVGDYWAQRIDAALSKQAEPVCATCNGTGDVHRADGEWLGECHCMKEHKARVAAGDLLAIAEEVGGQRVAANVAQVTREDLARIIQFVQAEPAEPAPAQDERGLVTEPFVVGYHCRDESDIATLEWLPHHRSTPLMTVAQHERIVASLTRPAQTEQQPTISGELREFLLTQTARQNLELETDRDIWKAEAERLNAELERMMTEQPEQNDRKDAERYRWLRSIGPQQLNAAMHSGEQQLDRFVDAAMSTQGSSKP